MTAGNTVREIDPTRSVIRLAIDESAIVHHLVVRSASGLGFDIVLCGMLKDPR
jgi:hypothetical protein